MNFHLAHFMYSSYYFSQIGSKAFYSNKIERGIDMLPKRSTPVDQNLESKSTHSQLSVAIFIARRIHLGAQKSVIYDKKSKNYETHKQPPPLVTFWRDIAASGDQVHFYQVQTPFMGDVYKCLKS